MKKFLNSPLFVGAIALFAVGVVIMNVVRPMMGYGTSSRASKKRVVEERVLVKNPENEKKPDQPAEAMSSDEIADRDRIRWRKNPALRDPFKTKEPVSRKARKVGKKAVAAVKRFRLYGIWVEPGVRFAAINNEIVSEGDRIGEYRVAKIKSDSVLLKGPKGTRLLKFRNR